MLGLRSRDIEPPKVELGQQLVFAPPS
jgi:hypothetical protein